MMDKELYLSIGRPRNVCVACGAPIAAAGKHPSAFFASEDRAGRSKHKDEDITVREDYCATCWDPARHAPASTTAIAGESGAPVTEMDFVGFWMARREPPKDTRRAVRNRRERNTALLAYFEALREKNDPADAAQLCFVAHLLMKYGAFKWLRSEPAELDSEGREITPEHIVFQVGAASADEQVSVPVVALEDAEAADIKRTLDEYLSRAVAAEEPATVQ